MATIKDVARVSGTSVGTVSRYLNGYEIKEKNRIKIEEAIDGLDFKINAIAQGLKNKKTKTVGILIPQISNIFSTRIIEGIEGILDRNGYSILVCDSHNNIKIEEKKIKFLQEKQVDGLILMPCEETGKHVEKINSRSIPVVLVDRLFKETVSDAVICDNVNGAYKAVEATIKNGHTKIALITGRENLFTSEERIKGYCRAHEDYNLTLDEDLIMHGDDTKIRSGYDSLVSLMERRNDFTAIFSTNYELTLGVIEAVLDKNLVIGKDVTVFGYDQEDLINIIRPTISIVKQPMEQIGYEVAKLLLRRMEEDYDDYPEILRLETEMIIAESIRLK